MQEINEKEIRQFYEEYREMIRRQEHYEGLLYFIYMKPEQKEKWFCLLKEKSEFQRKAFRENERHIARVILPFLHENEGHKEFSEEIAGVFLDEIIKMAQSMTFDNLLTVEMLKKLVVYYEDKNNLDNQILSCFYLGYFYGHMNNPELRQEVYQCYLKVASYREQYEEIKGPMARRAVLSALFNCSNWDREDEKEYSSTHLFHLLDAYDFYEKEKKEERSSGNFDFARIQILIQDEICMELLKPGREIFNERIAKIEEEYYRQVEVYRKKRRLSAYEYYNYWKYQKLQGKITEKEYYEKLYEYYREEPWQKLEDEVGYSYNYNNLIQMMPLFLPELFEGAEKFQFKWNNKLKKDVTWYYTSFPRTGNKAYIDRIIVNEMMDLLSHYNSLEALELYEHIMLVRQGSTEIHVRGVAKLVKEIAEAIIKRKPEYVVGMLGTETPEQVVEHRDEILQLLHQGALQHDRGKLFISTTVSMQVRKLTDQEFENIKKHPEYGLYGREQYQGLKKYANVILGHHKYYNGQGGYPENFDNQACMDKFAIDLITICDCLDAATDTLGRNYMKGKDVATVLDEMNAGKGVRYSPEIVDFIMDDEDIIKKLVEITSEGRKDTYYEVYHKFAKEKRRNSPL